jgi:Ca2+-binding EF-hand superfamily protein
MKQKINLLQERGSLPKNAETTISRVSSVLRQLENDDIKENIQHLKNRIQTIIQEADTDGDGYIDYQEFVKIMMGHS